MSTQNARARAYVAPLLLGLVALVAACAPPPLPPGIYFNPPSVGYVNHQYTPTATSSNGMPITFSLDGSSTGCSLTGGVLLYETVGNCVVNADQAGSGALPQVRRTITIHECPTLRAGVWTGPSGTTATVNISGSFFTGTADLTALGFGLQAIAGTVNCEIVNMTFNSTPLTGVLSPDGTVLTGSYSGITITLNAPV